MLVETVVRMEWLQLDGSIRYPLATVVGQRTSIEDGEEQTEYLLRVIDDATIPFWPLLDLGLETVRTFPPVAYA
jgi:hypothetical protein